MASALRSSTVIISTIDNTIKQVTVFQSIVAVTEIKIEASSVQDVANPFDPPAALEDSFRRQNLQPFTPGNWFMGDAENRCQICLSVGNIERRLFVLPYSLLGDGFTRNDVNIALQTEFDEARRIWLGLGIPVAMDVMRADLFGQQIGEKTKRDWYYDVIQRFSMSFQLLNGTMPAPVGPECQVDWMHIRGPLLGAIWVLRKVVEGQYGIGWNDGESSMFNDQIVGALVRVVSGNMKNEYRLSVADLRSEMLDKVNIELATRLGPGSSLARMPRTLQILGDLLLEFTAALANDAHCVVAHVRRGPHRR
ncbi:hypothetical protein LTR95_005816 [Oleoguttula sp. CCFEE 5521]